MPRWSWTQLRNLFLFTLLILTLLRLGLAAELDLIPDEAYYWTWSRDLNVCYYDQPGMIAWVAHLFTGFTQAITPLTARLPVIFFSLIGSILVFTISRELFGHPARAVIAALLLNLTPLFWSGSFLFLHDGPLLFFWMATALMLVRLQRTGKGIYIYLVFLCFVGAQYSKFTGFFLAVGIFLYLALTGRERHWFRYKELYLSILLAIILLLPILLWNFDHDWIAFKTVLKLGQGRPAGFVKHLNRFFSYHGASLLLISPLIYLAMVWGLGLGIKRWLSERDEATALCLALSLPTLLFFSLLTAKTLVQPNWSAMGYPIAIILMVEEIGRRWEKRDLGAWFFYSRKYWLWAISMALFLSLTATAHALFHFVPPREDWVKRDRLYKEFFGWRELGAAVGKEQRPGEMIMALRYQVAAELEFYTPNHQKVYCLNAFGRGNQYDFRNDYQALGGRKVLVVTEQPIREELAEKFVALDPPRRLKLSHRGVEVKTFYFYHGRGFDHGRGRDLSGREKI